MITEVLHSLNKIYQNVKMLSLTQICFPFLSILILRKTCQVNSQQNNPCELKSDSYLPKMFIIICFKDSQSKMMKNAFNFILKAIFVLKIFEFLS